MADRTANLVEHLKTILHRSARGLQTARPPASTPLAKSHWLGAPLKRMNAVKFSTAEDTKVSTSSSGQFGVQFGSRNTFIGENFGRDSHLYVEGLGGEKEQGSVLPLSTQNASRFHHCRSGFTSWK
jgi:hypothetical protein